ncbi:MAG: hypothetical protein IJ282_02235 [Lachnospiraceae bacterium]|nr:hypothetical protein [Lachnospiraceae bacterium]
MKKNLGEIWEPIADFYCMKKGKKGEVRVFILLPIIAGSISYIIGKVGIINTTTVLLDFCNDILNQLLTILALFISFCMAYLSILLTSSSENVTELKKTPSSYHLKGKTCSLYQVNANEITYILLAEILFLILIFFQKLGLPLISNEWIKVMLCINVAIFMHILLVMLVVVKNMYFSFWRNV